jgi:uncharacterized protein (DUF1330 family)
MPAYIVVEIDVHNPTEYEDYKKLTPGSLVNFQGKFIVRGGNTETLEGDWSPKRFVMIEFPTLELAKAWWASEEYAHAKALRQRTASSKMIVVEGI